MKGTRIRKFKAWLLLLDRRQQGSVREGIITDRPFTCHKLVLSFLDIWGFGSRPMFRTMAQLFTRPGYMMREYLTGQHLRFFPPFKMLVVLTLLLLILLQLTGVQNDKTFIISGMLAKVKNLEGNVSFVMPALSLLEQILEWFGRNMAYAVIVQSLFFVVAAWLVFRNKPPFLSFTETFFMQLYIACQMQMVAIVWVLLTFSNAHNRYFPYMVPALLAFVLHVYDYGQFFRLRPWQALWRTLLVVLVKQVILIAFVLLVITVFVTVIVW